MVEALMGTRSMGEGTATVRTGSDTPDPAPRCAGADTAQPLSRYGRGFALSGAGRGRRGRGRARGVHGFRSVVGGRWRTTAGRDGEGGDSGTSDSGSRSARSMDQSEYTSLRW